MSEPSQGDSRKRFIARIWAVLWSPSRGFALATLVIFGGVWGIVFWGGFNWALEETDTLQFCISCHEMRDTVYQEYKQTIHYQNQFGVRAACPDCHVPRPWPFLVRRKIEATNELWHKIPRHHRHAAEVRTASAGAGRGRLGRHEGKQFARVPQLSQ